MLNVENHADIEVRSKQLGGGFGAKASRSAIVACAAAVGSAVVKKPVRLYLDLNTNMEAIGKRFPGHYKYEVGFDQDGKLNGVKVDFYSDPGWNPNDDFLEICSGSWENAYSCQNFLVKYNQIKTNKPINTAMRAPFQLRTMAVIESIIEHVARYLNKDPFEVRKVNLYKKDDVTYNGRKLTDYSLDTVVDNILSSSEYEKRKAEIDEFNKNNRWKKRGISLVPMKYENSFAGRFYNSMVSIFGGDGSVLISHGGIEMGQGMNTKISQVCSHELGVPLEAIRIQSSNNSNNVNSLWTGGSLTTEAISLVFR